MGKRNVIHDCIYKNKRTKYCKIFYFLLNFDAEILLICNMGNRKASFDFRLSKKKSLNVF